MWNTSRVFDMNDKTLRSATPKGINAPVLVNVDFVSIRVIRAEAKADRTRIMPTKLLKDKWASLAAPLFLHLMSVNGESPNIVSAPVSGLVWPLGGNDEIFLGLRDSGAANIASIVSSPWGFKTIDSNKHEA